jgi:sugar lactone lactonase YvrE/enterochelin esterase-like enzyme
MRFLLPLLLLSVCAFAADDFVPAPEHHENPAVPHGMVTPMPPWESKIFPNTTRDWWVYVPAQCKPDQPAAVMVFQDGHDYVDLKGHWRVPIVFDNLIASGDMPPTIAILIDPGHDTSKPKPQSAWKNSNRSLEYDALGDRYARFLTEEILPEVEKQHALSHDPEMRAICGASSGAICAFTVAWEHPEAFRKVLSTIGSFTNIRGGNAYPSLIRKTEHKPIRIYQADTSGDLDNAFGNWPLANQQMHAALQYMGYDARFDFAEGYGHNSNHAGAIFPTALRWLWRKEKPTPEINIKGDLGGDLTLHKLLIPGEDWQLVTDGIGFADGPCTDAEGNLLFSDLKANAIYKIALDGTKTKIADEPGSGLKWGPDGRLYACQGSKKRLVALDFKEMPPAVEVIAEGVNPNDLAVSHRGHIYFTETGKHQVTFVDAKTHEMHAADVGITAPNGIVLSPDQGTLAVSDYSGGNVWIFRIEPDGSLSAKEPYMTMRLPIDPKGEFNFNEPPPYKKAAGGDGMASDTLGRYYVATALGVQVFDPTGRLCGVLPKPQPDKPLTSCMLAGPQREYLYVTNGDKIFRRKVQATGTIFFLPPAAK